MWLRSWADFANIRDSHFITMNEAFDDKRLFPESIVTMDKLGDVRTLVQTSYSTLRWMTSICAILAVA
jgi:hypothetical protein